MDEEKGRNGGDGCDRDSACRMEDIVRISGLYRIGKHE